MTGIYALVHMAVDLSCAFLVYTYVLGGEQWYLWLLLYNFCAFALQMPIGAAADRLDRNSCVAVGGCAGVLAGLLLGIVGFPAGAAVVAGIGNACFHVGGGIDVLNRSERRAAPLGIFVAPGALGIFLGTMLGRAGTEAAVWIGGLLILSAVVIRAAAGREKLWLTSGNAPFSFSVPSSSVPSDRTLMAAACFLAAVILRSYSGMIQNFPWKETLAGSGLILAGAVVLGKMAGGVLADKLGIQRTAFRSMCAAAVEYVHAADPVGCFEGISGGEGLWLRSADIRPFCGILPGLARRKQRRRPGTVWHPVYGGKCLLSGRYGSHGGGVPAASGLGA